MRILLTLFALLIFGACKQDTIPTGPIQSPSATELDQRSYPALPELYVPGDTTRKKP